MRHIAVAIAVRTADFQSQNNEPESATSNQIPIVAKIARK